MEKVLGKHETLIRNKKESLAGRDPRRPKTQTQFGFGTLFLFTTCTIKSCEFHTARLRILLHDCI
jgi:hypothetical protein